MRKAAPLPERLSGARASAACTARWPAPRRLGALTLAYPRHTQTSRCFKCWSIRPREELLRADGATLSAPRTGRGAVPTGASATWSVADPPVLALGRIEMRVFRKCAWRHRRRPPAGRESHRAHSDAARSGSSASGSGRCESAPGHAASAAGDACAVYGRSGNHDRADPIAHQGCMRRPPVPRLHAARQRRIRVSEKQTDRQSLFSLPLEQRGQVCATVRQQPPGVEEDVDRS